MSLLQVLLVTVIFTSALCNKELLLDVHWVIQGAKFGFSGFMTEFLGISSALRNEMPLLKVSKSFFKDSLEEQPVIGDLADLFHKEMFALEGDNMHYLYERNFPEAIDVSKSPIATFAKSDILDPAICQDASVAVKGAMIEGETFQRSRVVSANTANDCCQKCSQFTMCVAYQYSQSTGCQLFRTLTALVVNESSTSFTSADFSMRSKFRRPESPKAVIFHGTTCAFNNRSALSTRRDIGTIYIGRYMVERHSLAGGYGIDEYAVYTCASLMDEIWVPTTKHAEIFRSIMQSLGYVPPSLFVVPESVDTSLFDPKLVPSSLRYHKITCESKLSFIDLKVSVAECMPSITSQQPETLQSQRLPSSSCTADFETPEKCTQGNDIQSDSTTLIETVKPFEFLSVFKWEYRKGWDVLLTSYWSAFSRNDPVVLRIRSYVPKNGPGAFIPYVEDEVESFALKHFKKELSELAKVVVEDVRAESISESSGNLLHADQHEHRQQRASALSRESIRQLYSQADAFVLPTRGEGWGLPIAEAMSMEVPVLVTDGLGPQAYANESNAYMIPVLPDLDRMGFHQPDTASLATIMRKVVVESISPFGPAAIRAKNARRSMEELSPLQTVEIMKQRLKFHAQRRGWVV